MSTSSKAAMTLFLIASANNAAAAASSPICSATLKQGTVNVVCSNAGNEAQSCKGELPVTTKDGEQKDAFDFSLLKDQGKIVVYSNDRSNGNPILKIGRLVVDRCTH